MTLIRDAIPAHTYKSVTISMKITPAEYDRIKAEVRRLGLKGITEFLEMCIFDKNAKKK